MTSDEFENPDSSPVPPYDRGWRHPAEVADSERTRHLGMTPPLGRRLTALTVIASVLTSVAVLTVAIPKGIEEYTQIDESSESTIITAPPVKGSGLASIEGLRGLANSTSALSLGNHQWLVASEDIASRRFPATYGTPFTILRTNQDIGLSVIQVKAGELVPAINTNSIRAQLTSDDLHDCHIVDAFQTHTLASEPSLVSVNGGHSYPVNIETPIKGLAVALNKAGDIVGILVRKGHSQWMVPRTAILQLAGL